MAIPSRQIGGSTTTILLWEISKQLEKLICIRSGGCGEPTTTTTSTNTTLPPIECIVYNAANGNIYIYDVTTNLSVEILNGGASPNFQVANTDIKLWTAQGGGYVQEYDLTFTPGPIVTYNRSISTGSIINNGTFAINDTTLIVCDTVTLGIYELDITTTTATNTFKGNIEAGYIANDMLLTTSGKLIIVAIDIATVSITKVYQYDYATWTLETTIDLTSQLPALNYGAGIAQYLGNIYIFTRVEVCNPTSTPSGVYLLDSLTNNVTLVDSTGFGCVSGSSSWLPCNTTSLNSCLQCSLPDVTIGTQTWTACNLDVTTYQNGDVIPQVQDPVEWAALTTGAWCYYNNDTQNGCTYAKLYNWYAVNDPRGLAPSGYHVPTDSDFTTLYTYLGGEAAAGGALKEAGLAHWIAPNTDATNSSGFTALPGGVRNVPSGAFNLLSAYGFWWSATDNGTGAYSLQLLYNDGGVVGWGTSYFKTDGHSVRLIKDQQCCSVPNITIGTQTWTGCNLNVETYQNGDPIPQVQDPVAWAALTTGAWCYYENDADNGCTYGKLYNWYAVNDPRGLAPAGYHVPTDAECTTLVNYLGGLSVAGGPLKEAGTVHWASPNVGATNSTGFTFLPGGLRNAYVGDFTYISFGGGFWTTTAGTAPLTAKNLGFDYNNDDAYGGDFRKEVGLSVRLISDTPATTTSTTTLAPSGFNTIYTHFEAL